MPHRKNLFLALASMLLAAGLFSRDLVAPQGLPAGILYLALVLPGLWSQGARLLVASGCLATVLNLIVWLARPPQVAPSAELTERLVSALAVWIAVAIASKWKNERARAARIEQERARLAATLETLDAALLGLNLDGVIESWSAGAERLYGYAPGEVVGRPVSVLLPPDQANEFFQWLTASRESQSARRGQTARLRKDGTRVEISAEVSPVFDTSGHIAALCSVERDITESKRAENERQALNEKLNLRVAELTQELSQAKALYLDLYDNSSDLMAVTRLGSGEIISCNQALADALGRSKEDLIGCGYLDLYEPEFREKAKTTFEYFARTGRVLDPHRTLRLADGTTADALLRVTPVRDENGTTMAARSTWRDITELKKAEREIAARESLYRTLVESVPHIICRTDTAGHALFLSRAWAELTGRPVEQSLGLQWVESVHRDDQPRLLSNWVHAHNQNDPFRGAFRLQAKDGRFRDISASGTPVRDQDGRITDWVVVWLDVTDHNLAMREIWQSRERLRLVLEAGRVGTWITNLSDQTVTCDEGLRTMYGLATEETVLPRGVLKARVHADDRERVYERVNHSAATGEPLEVEYRIAREDGTIRHVASQGSVLRDDSSQPITMAGVCIDITAGKRAEEGLRESQELLSLALESGQIGSWVWKIGDHAMTCDARMRRIFELYDAGTGSEHQQLMARVDPEDAKRWRDSLDRISLAGGGFEHEIRSTWTDGTKRFIVIRGAVLTEPSGKPVRVAGVAIDVTERVLVRKRLAAANEQLARTNEDLEQFAYIASHDLRAPLRAIANLAEWIEEDLDASLSGETRENMDLLRKRVQRLEQLIDDLLKYSRAGRAREELTLVDTAELVQEVVTLLDPPEGFAIHVTPRMPVFPAAKTPLSQVFANLIGNAIKHHNRPDGRVEIAFSEKDDRYEFAVSDDGPGIPAELHERAFQIFRTLKPRDEVEGSGVGLAIVKRMVEHHGGVVSLESAQGTGATFRFTWPKKNEPTTSHEPQLESCQPAVSRG